MWLAGFYYIAMSAFYSSTCPATDFQQIDAIDGEPISLFSDCGIRGGFYSWKSGIYINRKLSKEDRTKFIEKEMCHAKQEQPRTLEEKIQAEVECGHAKVIGWNEWLKLNMK